MEADGGGSRRVERHRPAHAGGEIPRGSRHCEPKMPMIVAITRTVTRFCGHVTASPIHLHNAIGNASSLTSVSKRAQTSASSMRAQQHNTENTAQWRSSSITERRSCRREQHLLQAAPCNTAVHVCIAATTPPPITRLTVKTKVFRERGCFASIPGFQWSRADSHEQQRSFTIFACGHLITDS